MTNNNKRNTRIMQHSWVVNDLREAAQRWIDQTGIGPFFIVEGLTLEEQKYRGQDVHVEASFALAQAGDIQIELVCQHNDAPSAYRDTVPAGQEAFHHVALYCDDYDSTRQEYLDTGVEVAFSGSVGGQRFCYLDTTATIGVMMELIERSPMQDGFFQMIKDTAAEWDGTDPLRPAF